MEEVEPAEVTGAVVEPATPPPVVPELDDPDDSAGLALACPLAAAAAVIDAARCLAEATIALARLFARAVAELMIA